MVDKEKLFVKPSVLLEPFSTIYDSSPFLHRFIMALHWIPGQGIMRSPSIQTIICQFYSTSIVSKGPEENATMLVIERLPMTMMWNSCLINYSQLRFFCPTCHHNIVTEKRIFCQTSIARKTRAQHCIITLYINNLHYYDFRNNCRPLFTKFY